VSSCGSSTRPTIGPTLRTKKEITRDGLSCNALIGKSVDSKFSRPDDLCCEDLAQRRGYFAELLKERIGIAEFPGEVAFRRGAHYMKDFLRIANRQGAPQRRVEERKYRSVCSNAERESQDSNRGKAGILAQLTQRVANIL
jgi:hypothetical protein